MMNTKYVFEMAESHRPSIIKNIIKNSSRINVVDLLRGRENIGIELGVAAGGFSKKCLESGKFKKLFGVDSYCDIHEFEYKKALAHIGILADYQLIKMTFDDAIDLFPDHIFDFIYVDGFAHTGERGGRLLYNWYRKLKVGGIFAGDDYHSDWPLVTWAVNEFALNAGVSEILLTEAAIDIDAYSRYPSWIIQKSDEININIGPSRILTDVADAEEKRIHRARNGSVARAKSIIKESVFFRAIRSRF